jgi:hypothetical protein
MRVPPGAAGQSIRAPIAARVAGRSVSETATETSGINIPPTPMLRIAGTGSTISATRPIPTVTPESSTARPAVATAATTASWFVRPLARSSRQRVTISSE